MERRKLYINYQMLIVVDKTVLQVLERRVRHQHGPVARRRPLHHQPVVQLHQQHQPGHVALPVRSERAEVNGGDGNAGMRWDGTFVSALAIRLDIYEVTRYVVYC